MSDVMVTSQAGLKNIVSYGEGRSLTVDEPATLGGDGESPDPYTLILGALGSCISMTVTLYARRKGWSLERVSVRLRQGRVHAVDCEECVNKSPDAFAHRIERHVTLEGDLTDEQRARLSEIAHKCPVHKMLTSEIVISELGE